MAQKKKILIVDDEPFLSRVMQDKLETDGFSVMMAPDGAAGLEMALENSPDLILLDLVMPKMDGISMLKELRHDPRGREIPVVVMSNLNNAQYIDETLANGAQDFLVKVNNSLDDITRVVRLRLRV